MKLALLASCLAATTVAASAKRPNILMIAVDDLKPTLGAYGDPHALTPAIDRLAARGTVFANAHCQQAVCGPSRASLLTGLRPDTVRVWDLATRMRDQMPDLVTLPQNFKMSGYYTASFGKIFDPRCSDSWAEDDAISWSQPHSAIATPHLVYSQFADATVKAASEARRLASRTRGEPDREDYKFKPTTECLEYNVPDDTYRDGLCTSRAIELLRDLGQQGSPFFLAVGLTKPHLPFAAPRKYWDLYDPAKLPLAMFDRMPEGAPAVHFQDSLELREGYGDIPPGPFPENMQRHLIHGYYACVSYMDAQVARLITALETEGLADNTIIVLWGDHGFHLGDHGMWCKHTNYEQATRAPLIVVDPRRPSAGGLVGRPVEFIDIAPTLTELAGLPPYERFEGRSFVPLLADPAAPFKRFAVSQYPRTSKPGGREDLMGYSFRNERHRFVVWIEKDFRAGIRSGRAAAIELYDYASDPLETHNLATDPACAALAEAIERDAADFAFRELGMKWWRTP